MNFSKLNRRLLVLYLAAVPLALPTATHAALQTEKEKISYSIGADIGANFKKQEIEIDPKVFMRGMTDALGGKTLLLKSAEMEEAIRGFQKKMIKKRADAFKKVADKNRLKGQNFLMNNKKNSKVKTTHSGLQYEVIKEGSGMSPTTEDTVTVKYTGKLIDGTIFDSTEKSGQPSTFKLNEVIKGWTEALQMMKPGGHWKVFIPPELAYGERGVGGPIGPNETLIFDIELLSVNKK